jgi:ribosomal protein S27E
MRGFITRLPGRGDTLEVQAKVCIDCGQLVLTYRESVKCIVCGGTLRQAKKENK